MLKPCKTCGVEFDDHPAGQRRRVRKYCSVRCCRKFWNDRIERDRKEYQIQRYLGAQDKYREQQRQRVAISRIERPWHRMILASRARARAQNLPFSISEEWARARWIGTCELTGITFRLNIKRGESMALSPSMDKIDPKKGYTEDNCRFILWCLNSFKGQETDATMYAIAARLCEAMRIAA